MATLDLDKLRAARAEREPKLVRFRGHDFTLPPTLPMAVQFGPADMEAALESGDEEQIGRAALDVAQRIAKALLGDQYALFLSLGADQDDVLTLVDNLTELYGVTVPESSASSDSSPNGGTRSRQTSNASTDSTSPTPSSTRRSARVG